MRTFNEIALGRSPSRIPQINYMPAVVAPVIASITGLAATSFAVQAIAYIAVTAATSIVLSALAPKPDLSSMEGMQANQRSNVASREYVYGQVRKGGTITYMESTGVKNKYLHMVLVLAGHELSEIGDIYINDEVVTLDADGFATGDTWKSKVRIKKHLGDQTTADAALLEESEQIDSAFVGNGCAYLYIRLEYDSDVFANGIPLFTAIVKGAKVYDPRQPSNPAAYSNNPALCIRHYLTASYGLGDTSSEIDDVAFAAAANVCDEDIALAAGGTQNQYEINGVVSASMTFGDALSKMLSACAGTLFWGGGKWQLKPGYYSTPTASFTLDDLRGTISGSPRANMRDSFNSVRGKFNDADQDWITVDYPEITSTVFVDEDNGFEQPLDLELPFTTSSPMAQRLAKITLYRARDAITFSADFGLSALSTQIGDTVSLTIDRYGWDEKTFEVTGWKFYANQDAGDLRVNLVLREISASSFDWDADETEIVSNNTSLPTFNTVPAVTSLALEDGSFFGSDGTHYNGIRASWTASDDAFVERYQVQWKLSGQSEYQTLYTSETDAIISPLSEEQLYDVRVRAINIVDVKSDWVSDSFTTLEDQEPPAAPTSVTTTPGINNVVVSWVNPTDTDLDQVEIIRSEVNDINDASAEPVAYVRGSYYVDVPPVVDQTYYYFVRAIDRTGNIGTPATVTTGGSRLIQSYDVDAGAIDLTSLSTDVINTLAEKVDIADYNITVDYQQQLDDAVTLLGTNALTLALNASSLESRINDAGITVDPSTGSVTIQGLSAIENQVNQVVIDLDAVEGELSLKATTTYVNNAIAAATLPEATIAELDDLIARVDTAEIDISSIEGAITLTSTGLFYDVDDIDSRFTVTEGEIDVLQGQIVLKAEQTDLDNVEGRVTSAEVTINALDVPSITLAVQDVRSVANKLDYVSELTLAELLGRYADRQYLSQDIAYARQSLTADVNDQKVALSTATLELGAQIDDNRALIVEEQTARASEDAVLAESVTTLSGSLFGDTGAITQINNVSLDSTSGIAQAVALLNTELELADGQFGVVTNLNEVIDDVSGIQAKYTVKVNVNDHISGFGLISSANDGVPTSEFIVAADTFKIGAPVEGNVSDAAFAVYTEETVVGGITYPAGTYVNGFLNAENINVGTLNANRIQLDSAAFETDVDGNLIIVASGLPADQLKLGGEFKYNVTSKALEVNALSADSITSGTISTSLLDIDGTTLAIDGVTSALVVGTIDGAGNITPGSITAASIDAATITTDKLVLGSGTTLVDDGEGGLIVGTIDGVDNITPGSITADSIAANTITAGLINLGDTSLASDGSGGLVVGTFDGDDHINSGTISAGLLRLGNTTLGDDGSGQLVVGQIDGAGNISPGSITADRVDANFIDAFSINADNITAGSLSADRISIDGVTIDTDGAGNLIVGDGGISTIKIADSAINGTKIASESIAYEAFAAGIQPVGIVDVLPIVDAYNGPITVVLTTDGKLYRLVDGEWTAAVNTDDIQGTIGANLFSDDLRPVEVVGELPVTDLTQGRIVLLTTDSKMYRYTGSEWSATVPATDLTGQITETQITDSAITTSKIAANAVTADTIDAGAITAEKLAVGSVSADSLAANSVTAFAIAAGSIISDAIAANSISSDSLQTNSIVASKISAGAVTAAKMRIGDFMNYAENADFELGDTAWDTGQGGFTIESDGNSYAGAYSLRRTTTSGNTDFCVNDFQFSAAPGDQFNVSAYVKVSATYGGGGVGVGIRWFQSNGTFISSQQSNITATTAWQKVEANLTAPALAAYGVGQCRNVSQTAGTAYWDNFTLLKKQSGAALIVNGTIEANQLKLGTASLSSDEDGALVLGDIQSDTYESGVSGWSIKRDGSAEFNEVVISRQLLVDSGGLNFGDADITKRTNIGVTFEYYLEATNVPISAWAGAKKTYICNVGVSGTIIAIANDLPDVYWGFTGDILPLTRYAGNQTLRLRLRFWTKNVTQFENLQASWKIYEVT
jgi:hypothetical protein